VREGGEAASNSGLIGVGGPGVGAKRVGGEHGGEASPVAMGSSLIMGLTLATVFIPCVVSGTVTGTLKADELRLEELGNTEDRRVDEEDDDELVDGIGRVIGDAVTSPLGSVLMWNVV
jgi:hypothetical protein